MNALPTAVSMLAADDPDTGDNSSAANGRKAIRILAAMPTLVAAHQKLAVGAQPLRPYLELGQAGNFAYVIMGRRSNRIEAHTLGMAMALNADERFGVMRSFALRMTASRRELAIAPMEIPHAPAVDDLLRAEEPESGT